MRSGERSFLLACVGAVLANCTIESEQPVLEGSVVHLAILHTSDIHSRLFPYDLKPNTNDQGDGLYIETAPYGGLERIAGLLDRERRRGERVIYLDSGDIYQGAPIFNFALGEPEFRWLSLVGADAVALGNHEFDSGPLNLAKQALAWINYPLLAANYIFEDWRDETKLRLGRVVEPFTVLNVQGLRLGVIGMGDTGSMVSITQGGNSSGITPIEANETVRAYVEFLHPAVDLVVVLSHLGLSEDQELTDGHEMYLREEQVVAHFLNRPRDPWKRLACQGCKPGIARYWVPGVRGIDLILGGHLHILTEPPMLLRDPAGREVLLEHPGAFAKFMTRLDLAVAMPRASYRCDAVLGKCTPEDNHFSFGHTCASDADCSLEKLAPYGPELVSHRQTVFPLDTIWCGDPRPSPDGYANGTYDPLFKTDLQAVAESCRAKGHAATRNLLEPYQVRMELDPRFDLTQIFGFAPKEVLRKDTGQGGDSALGNMTALAMMIRKRVEAEFAVTNTLGIRDNFYPGVLDLETIFNVFPFENTITVMYLSGAEIQEMFDFVTERSAGRGCQSQAQIAGCSFVMNCGQVKRNEAFYPCTEPADCCQHRPELCEAGYTGTARWECNQGSCYAHPAEDIRISRRPLNLDASYKLATNDYIARGGSGFDMLKRNTTKVDSGIPLRDALIEFLGRFPTCRQVLSADPNTVDPFALTFCQDLESPERADALVVKGACSCLDLRRGDLRRCRSVGPALQKFCASPNDFPIVLGEPDGRIQRKVN